MTSQKTEIRGLAIRRWHIYKVRWKDANLFYTPQYRRFMVWVGRCIKRGGAVTMTTYVENERPVYGNNDAPYDKLDATLDWTGT